MDTETTKLQRAVSRMAQSVEDLHVRFDIPDLDDDWPTNLATLRARLSMLVEETGEHAQALNKVELSKSALEAADVLYVAIGTMLVYGDLGVRALVETYKKTHKKNPKTRQMTAGKAVKVIASE